MRTAGGPLSVGLASVTLPFLRRRGGGPRGEGHAGSRPERTRRPGDRSRRPAWAGHGARSGGVRRRCRRALGAPGGAGGGAGGGGPGRRPAKHAVQADVTGGAAVARMADGAAARLGWPDIGVAGAVIRSIPGVRCWRRRPGTTGRGSPPASCGRCHWPRRWRPPRDASADVVAERGLDGIVRTLAKEWGRSGIGVKDGPRPYPQRQRPGRRGGALRRLHPVRAARSPRHRRRALLASARAAFIADAHLPVAGGRVLPAT